MLAPILFGGVTYLTYVEEQIINVYSNYDLTDE